MRDRKLVGSRQRSLSRRFNLPHHERPLLAGKKDPKVSALTNFGGFVLRSHMKPHACKTRLNSCVNTDKALL